MLEVFGSEIEYAVLDPSGRYESDKGLAGIVLDSHAQRRTYGLYTTTYDGNMHPVCRITSNNGGGWYVDCGHPEFAGPECKRLSDLVHYEQASRVTLQDHIKALSATQGIDCQAYANNSDGTIHSLNKGYKTYGYHLNISAPRKWVDYRALDPYLATIQLFTGSGEVIPSELSHLFEGRRFALSPRALSAIMLKEKSQTFIGHRSLLYTMDKEDRKVLHITVFDTNISGYITAFKAGFTVLIKRMVEEGWRPKGVPLPSQREMVANLRSITLQTSDWTYNSEGKTIPAIDILQTYLEAAEKKFGQDPDPDIQWVLKQGRRMVDNFKRGDIMGTLGIDWVNKIWIMEKLGLYKDGGVVLEKVNNRKSDMARLACLAYHIIDPTRSTYALYFKDWSKDPAVIRATQQPPLDTRAFGRSLVVRGVQPWASENPSREVTLLNDWDLLRVNNFKFDTPDPFHTYEDEAHNFLDQHFTLKN